MCGNIWNAQYYPHCTDDSSFSLSGFDPEPDPTFDKKPRMQNGPSRKKGAAGRIRPSITKPKPDPDQTLEKDRIRPSRKPKSGSDPEKTTWSI